MSNLARNVLAIAILAQTAFPGTAAPAVTLPGGATAIDEVHSDWTVKCGVTADEGGGAQTSCGVSQQQLDKTTRKRVLAIGLSAGSNGGVKGSLVMPFGLVLDSGVTLQVDDRPVSAPLHFRTCLPAGCVVPIEWSADTVTALRAAQKLKLVAQGDNGKPVPFTISMLGFASALDRATALVPSK